MLVELGLEPHRLQLAAVHELVGLARAALPVRQVADSTVGVHLLAPNLLEPPRRVRPFGHDARRGERAPAAAGAHGAAGEDAAHRGQGAGGPPEAQGARGHRAQDQAQEAAGAQQSQRGRGGRIHAVLVNRSQRACAPADPGFCPPAVCPLL